MDDGPEAQLAGRIGTDAEALDRFYRRHVAAMVGFFARRVATPADVADLVAETFVAAIDASGRFDPRRGRDRPWLYGIATRVLAGSRRRAGREAGARARLSGRRLLEPDDISQLEERLVAEGAARALYDALAILGDRDRALLELIALDGLSANDAAAVLGISRPAVRMRLSRARARARSLLSNELAAPLTSAPHVLAHPEA